MEEIIGIIVTIAISALYSWVKDRKSKKARSSQPVHLQGAAAPVVTVKSASPSMPSVPKPRLVSSPIPEEGVRVTDVDMDADVLPMASGTDPTLDAWRQKWRDALIAHEVLSTKF